MDGLDRVLVRHLLEHAEDHPWKIQDTGVLGLWLDEPRSHRLHIWAPDRAIGPPVIHDHPLDFVSTVIVGELVNTRYVEDPDGVEYVRERYALGHEHERVADTVRLRGSAETLRAGDEYVQLVHELHDSQQVAGTVTVLRMTFREVDRLTSCRLAGTPWVTGAARLATTDEVKQIVADSLDLF